MMDGTNLNVLQTSRQMLRAFGGLNEGYGCSEAEFSGEMNFSSRGYPALQTRKMRRNVRTVQGVNGMYHLNGLLICRGKTLEYTPDEEARTGAVVLENVLTDDRKAMAGMGTKVLIWPDKVAFDTGTGELTRLGSGRFPLVGPNSAEGAGGFHIKIGITRVGIAFEAQTKSADASKKLGNFDL